MYCPSCGIALSQRMKYCNRCGAQLITAKEASEIESSVQRLDEYLTGLFWVTVFGLGLILGGLVLMKKVELSEWIIIAFMIVASLAFSINFALNLKETLRLMRISKEAKGAGRIGQLDTNELDPAKPRAPLEAAPSVTENTTRRLDPMSKNRSQDESLLL